MAPAPPWEAPRPTRLVALVDCSAFYCSCDRAFDPRLEGVPVAVLSNNDGCIIARSEEVKALGVPMGAPFFKHRDALDGAGVRVFSGNYTLYGDVSRCMMEALESVTPDVEPHSIDEAFLSVPTPEGRPAAVCAEMERRAAQIRERVRLWTGIPVRSRSSTRARSRRRRASVSGPSADRPLGVSEKLGLEG